MTIKGLTVGILFLTSLSAFSQHRVDTRHGADGRATQVNSSIPDRTYEFRRWTPLGLSRGWRVQNPRTNADFRQRNYENAAPFIRPSRPGDSGSALLDENYFFHKNPNQGQAYEGRYFPADELWVTYRGSRLPRGPLAARSQVRSSTRAATHQRQNINGANSLRGYSDNYRNTNLDRPSINTRINSSYESGERRIPLSRGFVKTVDKMTNCAPLTYLVLLTADKIRQSLGLSLKYTYVQNIDVKISQMSIETESCQLSDREFSLFKKTINEYNNIKSRLFNLDEADERAVELIKSIETKQLNNEKVSPKDKEVLLEAKYELSKESDFFHKTSILTIITLLLAE